MNDISTMLVLLVGAGALGASTAFAEPVPQISVAAFLVWHCWFLTARVIPRLHRAFREDLSAILASHEHVAELWADKFSTHKGEDHVRK